MCNGVSSMCLMILLLFSCVCLLQIHNLQAFFIARNQPSSSVYTTRYSLLTPAKRCTQLQAVVAKKKIIPIDERQVLRADEYSVDAYRGDLLEKYYNQRPLQVWDRLIDIGSPIATWWLATKFDNLTASWRSAEEQQRLQRVRAAELKDAIVQGKSVTFIKSGQALALRPDLLKSTDYVEELQKLQDEVGTFENEIAMQIIADDLGRPPQDMFDFDPPYPIASASIGQVYRARLKTTNELVAVKVQRPDSMRTVPVDMYILRKLANYVKTKRKLRSNLVGIADGFGEQLYQELNYLQEAANCKKFKQYYGDIPGIYVPDIYDNYTSRRVLTMEFVEGVKGPWTNGGEKMLTIGLQCSVLQLLGTGFFHSDPHRGNLLQTPKGELAYLDFGMMNEIASEQRYAMIGVILGLVNQDLALMIRSMETLEFFVPGTNVTNVIAALKTAVKDATNTRTSTDPSTTSTKQSLNTNNLNFTRLNENIVRIQNELPIQLPPFYTMIIRSLTILEGLALYVDKDFRLVKGAYPFVAKQILSNPTPELNRLLRSVLLTEEGRIRWDKLESLLSIAASANDAVEKGNFQGLKQAQDRSDVMKKLRNNATMETDEESNNVTIEIISRILDYLLSENGNYLREPLIDEIIEITEALGLTSQRLVSLATFGIIPSPKQNPDREKLMNFFRVLNTLFSQSASKLSSATLTADDQSDVRKSSRTSSMAVLTKLFIFLQDFLANPQMYNVQLEKLQPIIGKLTLLARQVVGKVVERNTRSFIQNMVTPGRVEQVLPLISRALDMIPVDFVTNIFDRTSDGGESERGEGVVAEPQPAQSAFDT